MSPPVPGGWTSRLTTAAVSILVIAVALYLTVRLIEAVWLVLLIATLGVLGGYIAWGIRRRRRSGW